VALRKKIDAMARSRKGFAKRWYRPGRAAQSRLQARDGVNDAHEVPEYYKPARLTA